MAVLLVSRQVTSARAAAGKVAHLAEQGSNREAIIERLRRTYRQHRADLEAWAQGRLNDEISPILLRSMSGPAREEAKWRRRRMTQALLESEHLSDEEVRSVNAILDRTG